MLIDSNIIIYASKMDNLKLLHYIRENEEHLHVSAFSVIEVLGYHKLKSLEKQFLQNFFKSIIRLEINHQVVDKTIELKQKYPLSVGDGIIAATAIVYDLPLFTYNIKDFKNIKQLKLISPQDVL